MFDQCLPEEAGVRSEGIVRFLDDMKTQGLHLHTLMILRHGKVIARAGFEPWSAEQPHMLYSLSKSFTSTAVGFAVQDGLLHLSDRLVSFFPEYLPAEPCENMRKITIRHLLTMNTGHHTEPRHMTDCWEREFLQSYVEHEPGSRFVYNTFATYMLAAVVQKVTGKKLLAWLREKLMDPLGMSEDIWFEESPTGVATGGYGLNVHVDDIAKLGQFYLKRGVWEGRRLLDEKWILEAQTAWSDNSITGNASPDWTSGYGYQFWLCEPDHIYRGDGAFGQYCVIMPDQDMVVAINSGEENMPEVLRSLWRNVLPAIGEPCAPSGALTRRLADTVTRACWEEKDVPAALPVPDQSWLGRYRLENGNPLMADTLTVMRDALKLSRKDAESVIPLNRDTWQHFTLDTGDQTANPWHYLRHMAARAAITDGRLALHLCGTRTPFEYVILFRFTEHGLSAHVQRNVAMNEPKECDFIGFRTEDA